MAAQEGLTEADIVELNFWEETNDVTIFKQKIQGTLNLLQKKKILVPKN